MGRKRIYNRERLMPVICERIAAGESMLSIEKEKGMPNHGTFLEWVDNDESFAHQYARAMAIRAERMAQEIEEIADHGTNDWMAKNDPGNPGYLANGEHIQRSRLRVDTRKWLLSKMMPKKYGDHLEMNVKADIDITATIVTRAEEIRAKLRTIDAA